MSDCAEWEMSLVVPEGMEVTLRAGDRLVVSILSAPREPDLVLEALPEPEPAPPSPLDGLPIPGVGKHRTSEDRNIWFQRILDIMGPETTTAADILARMGITRELDPNKRLLGYVEKDLERLSVARLVDLVDFTRRPSTYRLSQSPGTSSIE